MFNVDMATCELSSVQPCDYNVKFITRNYRPEQNKVNTKVNSFRSKGDLMVVIRYKYGNDAISRIASCV